MSPRARRVMLALALLSTYWSITPLLEDVEHPKHAPWCQGRSLHGCQCGSDVLVPADG